MTDEKMTLFELIQKADSTDFLKELAATALQRLMEFEVDDLCGAGRHERPGTEPIPQRPPRPVAGNAPGHARPEDPKAAQRDLLSAFPGSPQNRREGADGRDPGSLDPGCVDAQGR